jgi:hypothetical protein
MELGSDAASFVPSNLTDQEASDIIDQGNRKFSGFPKWCRGLLACSQPEIGPTK